MSTLTATQLQRLETFLRGNEQTILQLPTEPPANLAETDVPAGLYFHFGPDTSGSVLI